MEGWATVSRTIFKTLWYSKTKPDTNESIRKEINRVGPRAEISPALMQGFCADANDRMAKQNQRQRPLDAKQSLYVGVKQLVSIVNEISLNVIKLNYMSLFNGAKFPDYIFKERPLYTLFFEFDNCFSDDFVQALSSYLRKVGVEKITINNVEPEGLPFNQIIDTDNLNMEFELVTKTPMIQDYIASEASFYMMTALTEIFPSNNVDQFTLVLDRNYEIGILGATSDSFFQIFDNFKLENVHGYLSAFMIHDFTNEFENKLKRNYLQ